MKKIVKLISLILAMMIFIVGCGLTEKKTQNSSEVKNQQEKKEIITSDSKYINLSMIKPTTINPIFNTNKSVSYVLDLVYDGLFEFDENYNIQPKLVDSYDISSDNKSVKIVLKDDIKWHNGNKLTASDVSYTYNLIKSTKQSAYNSLVSNISSIYVTGEKSLTVYFKNSYAFSLETLIFPIVSQSKMAYIGTEAKKLAKNNLVGCGEYKIKSYEDREYMVLEKYKKYYNYSKEGNDRKIYVKIVPDLESQIQMVLSNDSDMTKVTLGDISKFTDTDKFTVEEYQSRNYEYVMFNYENEYLKRLEIRKAISFAIDRNSIINDAYSNRAKMVNFPLAYNSEYYDKELKPLSYNTDNANNYLKKAIVAMEAEENRKLEKEKQKAKEEELKLQQKNNANKKATLEAEETDTEDAEAQKEEEQTEEVTETEVKVRDFNEVKPSEVNKLLKNIKLKIIVNKNNSERTRTASIISNNLEDININTEIVALTEDEMTEALKNKDYDLAIIGCQLPAVSDASSIINRLGYKDKKLDNYFSSLQQATSEKKIKNTYKEIQEYVRDKAIFISIGILDDYVVLNNRLNGELYSNDFNIYRGISAVKIN